MKRFFAAALFFAFIIILMCPVHAENWVTIQQKGKPLRLFDTDSVCKFNDGALFMVKYITKTNTVNYDTVFIDSKNNKAGVLSKTYCVARNSCIDTILADIAMKDFSNFNADFNKVKEYIVNNNIPKCPFAPGFTEGEASKSNMAGLDWENYLENLRQSIHKNWHPPKHPKTAKSLIVVHLEIVKDGSLVSYRFDEAIKDTKAKKAIIRALKASTPFGPLPDDYTGNIVKVKFTFDYNYTAQTESHNHPGIRRYRRNHALEILEAILYLPLYIIYCANKSSIRWMY